MMIGTQVLAEFGGFIIGSGKTHRQSDFFKPVPEFTDVTVIVAVPVLIPVTTPFESTVATEGLLETYVVVTPLLIGALF